jgi:hypothetical protein|tara:strand:+ start:315 stop:614 length:300 start_codon:yes stop_codon:yes gene_type:complete
MDTDSINELEFRKGIHSTFHVLSIALRNGDETDELMADILQQVHIAYAAKDNELLETILKDIRPHTEIILADAIEGLDTMEKEIRHMRVVNNIIGVHLN